MHTTTKGEILKTHALKVVTTSGNNGVIPEGLIDALTDTPTKHANSTTDKFKLVLLRNTEISKDRITDLIVRQNEFSHATMATSAVDGGICDDTFKHDEGDRE